MNSNRKESVQFLVTVTIGYDSPKDRREAIAEAQENLLSLSGDGGTTCSKPIRAKLVKRPKQ